MAGHNRTLVYRIAEIVLIEGPILSVSPKLKAEDHKEDKYCMSF